MNDTSHVYVKKLEEELHDLKAERGSLNQKIDRLYQRIPYCLMLCIDLINELAPEKREPFQNRLNRVWPAAPKGEQADE